MKLKNSNTYSTLSYWYIGLHLLMIIELWYSNSMLSLSNPILFIPRLDLTQFVFINRYVFSLIENSYIVRLTIDLLYILFPFCCFYSLTYNFPYFRKLLILITSCITLFYGLVIDATTYIHFESFIMFGLFILIFYYNTEKDFYFSFNAYRYIFLFIFFSSGLWKVRTGAIFNIDQMSGILLQQHYTYLLSSPHDMFSIIVKCLISNNVASFFLFIIATVLELTFAIGFFTKKYDKFLFVLFISFVAMDYYLMEINYFYWIGYAITLIYSSKIKLTHPKATTIKL